MSVTIDYQLLNQLISDVFEACGAPEDEAVTVAEHLVTANLMGYDTHGVIRVPQYLEGVAKGAIVPGASITIGRETETTGVVDCNWNFGQVGGRRAMEIAIEKARKHHVATVVVRRANHAGRLGAYTQQAAEAGMLAIGVCNSPIHGHFVLPWGGTEGRLATNPISFAIPSNSNGPILADFSTAESSEGAIRLHRNLGKPLPPGWIVDSAGMPTNDPADFYGPPQGAILPFGGPRGYRGFALSVLVEVLGGIMSGSSTLMKQPGNGLGFIVVDTRAFMPLQNFEALVQEMREYIKSSPPAPGCDEVMLPGEPDYRNMRARRRDGIPIDDNTWEQIVAAGSRIGVEFPEVSRATQS
jgi:LDH2 family malate/lactate/ureidoglycolate dehydrogenase